MSQAAAPVTGKAVRGSDYRHKRPYAILLVALAAICVVLSPTKEAAAGASKIGTVWESSSVITPSDSSACTVSAAETPRDDRTMNENGPYALARSANAWIFNASCDGGANTFEIRVHPDFTTQQDAATEAEKYGKAAGRLPKVLRSGTDKTKGIRTLAIHKGSHLWHASSRLGSISTYTELTSDAYIEEVMFHEAAHVSLDKEVKSDSKWLAAQKADGAFISSYAKDNSASEDVAESFLAYFSARYVPTRIDSDWKDPILQTIPNRIAYFDALLSAGDMKPFTAAPVKKVALPSVSVAAKAASATEGAGAVFTVTASPAPTADLTVSLAVADDTASDFLAASDEGKKTVTITAGQSSAELTVPTQDDSADEADGSVTATIQAGDGYTPSGTNASASVAVSDNDAAPSACVPEQLLEKVEGYYDHNKARPPGYGVNWFRALVALGARSPDGWTADSRTILPMTAADARAREANWFGWAPVAEALECLEKAVPAEPEITIAGGAGITEGAGAVFTVSASPAPTADLVVTLTVADDTNSDFLAQADEGMQTVTIAGGQASGTLTFTTVNDSTDEADGSVTATVSSAAGYTIGSPSIATVAVADDDVLPAVGIAAGNAVTEGAAAVFTLTATPVPQSDITVKVNIADSGAFASGGAAGARQVTIGTSGTATLDVTTDDDATDEPDGGITATIEAGSGYTIGTSGTASVAVSDDDEPVLSVTISPASASEGDTGRTYATVTFGLDPVRGEATSFKACLKSTGTAARGASSDYQLVGAGSDTPLTLASDCHGYTLAANAASGTGRLLVRGDADVEPDETVVVELQDPPAGVTVSGIAGSATYTILNDDTAPASSCVPEQLLEKVEGYYDHNKSRPPGYGANWFRALVALGARSPDGWTADSRTILPMTAADARAREANWFGWGPVADALECLEGAVPAEPEITIAGGNAVTEGAGAVFTVTASPAPVADLTVSLTVADDASSDFLAQADEGRKTVTIAGGQASADLTIATQDDSTDEADGSGYTPSGTNGSASVAVSDNDDPTPTPAVSIAAGSGVTEGTDASFTITASPPPATPLAVALTIGQGGDVALAGETGSKTVTIPVSGSLGIDIATVNDALDEPDGSITATVDAGDGYTVGSPSSQTVAVADDDATPATPILSLSPGTAITEGGAAGFTVTADPAPSGDLTIAYSVTETGDHLAAPGAGSRTAVLTAGTASTDLSVATVDDAADEADGSVSVTLGTGTGYAVATGMGSATVTVADDDVPTVSVTGGNGVTEGSPASFTVSADPAPAAPLDVTLTVDQSGDFATSGQTGTRTVTIPVAGTATLTVTTVDDGTDEPNGSVTATVQTGSGYTVATAPNNAASITVADDDAAPGVPTLSIADATLNENERLGWFTVRLSEATDQDVRFAYATRDSTPVSATANRDYSRVPRAWRIGSRIRAGETFTEIRIGIRDDSHDENPETFEVELIDAFMYRSGQKVPVSIADGVAVGTIVNDDPMPAAWLSRFGRTVAEQALDAVAGRMAAARTRGIVADTHGTSGELAADPMSMDARDALLASGFTLTTGSGDGGSTAFWGRAARSGFDGHDGTFSLDGEATTVTLGADHARGRWLAGLALLRSSGDGSYRDDGTGSRDVSRTCAEAEGGMDPEARAVPCDGAVREGDGTVEATLSAAVPYAALQASERIGLWGALGTGSGEVTLRPETGGALSSDLSWSMAAAGLRGDLLDGTGHGSGPALAVVSDALWTRTRSERTHELAASGSATSRLRLGLEGGWTVALGNGGSLSPRLEAGLRHDGGDAETGFGIDLGGGIAWTDPGRGLSLGLSGRTLVAHEDGGFRDRGLALDVAWDPRPETGRGWSASLSRSLGGSSSGGVAALLGPDAFPDASPGGGGAWSAEVAHGTALGAGMVASPYGRVGGTLGAKDEVRLGWRAGPDAPHAEDATLDLWAEPVTGGGGRAVSAGLEWRW